MPAYEVITAPITLTKTALTFAFTSVYQGTSIILTIPIYSLGTTPAVLTAPSGTYATAVNASASSVLLAKSGVLTQDPTSLLWTMTVTLASTDTGSLPAGRLIQQITIEDSDGTRVPVVYMLNVLAALSDATIGISPVTSSYSLDFSQANNSGYLPLIAA